MKIIPFSPTRQAEGPKSPGKAPARPGDDFQKYLDTAGQRLKARDKVGLENLIANETAPPGDLSQAASLLSGVIAQLGLKTPAELGKIHDLEGLVYF
jgi:hypothetical protein